MPDSILIIDDDPRIIEMVGEHLQEIGYVIDFAYDGEVGFQKAITNNYSLVILDVHLPKLRGFELCKRLRQERSGLPIIMLTACSDEVDIILGLEFGADDYLTKPFSVRQLAARVSALLRRVVMTHDLGKEQSSYLKFGNLHIDTKTREVYVKGVKANLSSSEYNMLNFLANHPGQAFAKDELIEKIWGYSASGYESVITTTLCRLRNKIEDDAENPRYIKTVRGFGYRFAKLDEL